MERVAALSLQERVGRERADDVLVVHEVAPLVDFWPGRAAVPQQPEHAREAAPVVLVLVRDDDVADGAAPAELSREQRQVRRLALARVEQRVRRVADQVRVGALQRELARVLAEDSDDRVRDLAVGSRRAAWPARCDVSERTSTDGAARKGRQLPGATHPGDRFEWLERGRHGSALASHGPAWSAVRVWGEGERDVRAARWTSGGSRSRRAEVRRRPARSPAFDLDPAPCPCRPSP